MAKKKKKKDEDVTVIPVKVEEKDTRALAKVETEERNELIKRVVSEVPALYKEAQARLALNETPLYRIKKRKGRGGFIFDYVDVYYVIEMLNLLFGYRWSHQIWPSPKQENWVECQKFALESKQWLVVVRLTVPDPQNKPDGYLYSEEGGRAEIKMQGEKPMDYGNDYKAAISDALKRCASRFGIALDVYSGAVARRQDSEHPDSPITETQRKRLEVLATEAKLGHSGLKKMIAKKYDYDSTTKVQRRHFSELVEMLQRVATEVQVEELDIPADLNEAWDILETPKAKRVAAFKSYTRKEGGLEQLKRKLSAEVDKRNTKQEVAT